MVSMDGAKGDEMALNKKLAMMIMGPKMKMSSPKEEKAEKSGKKGFPVDSAKEESLEMQPKKRGKK